MSGFTPTPQQRAMVDRRDDEEAYVPLMNWTKGDAHSVAARITNNWDQIVQQFYSNEEASGSRRPKVYYRADVTRVEGDNSEVQVKFSIGNNERILMFHYCIDAAGPGAELSVDGLQTPPYWRVDDLDQPFGHHQKILISGNGDGAIADLLRCRIENYRQDPITALNADKLPESQRARLKLLEEKVEKEEPQDDALCEEMEATYLRLVNEEGPLREMVETNPAHLRFRSDTDVVLHVRGNPFTFKAIAINRLGLALLISFDQKTEVRRCDDFEYRVREGGGFDVKFEGATSWEHFDRILIRRGVRIPSFRKIPRTNSDQGSRDTGRAARYKPEPRLEEDIEQAFGGVRSIEPPLTIRGLPPWGVEPLFDGGPDAPNRLTVDRVQLRSVKGATLETDLTADPSYVALVGSNGSGKTTILEAIALLGHLPNLEGGIVSLTEANVVLDGHWQGDPFQVRLKIPSGDVTEVIRDNGVNARQGVRYECQGCPSLIDALRRSLGGESSERRKVLEGNEWPNALPFVSYINTDAYDYGVALDIRESPKDLAKDLSQVVERLSISDGCQIFGLDAIQQAWSYLVTGERDLLRLSIKRPHPEADWDVRVYRKGQVASDQASISYLSSGENQLLFLCLILFGMRPSGCILLLDEPELHLSPAAIVRLREVLIESCRKPRNQVIVATHSSFLVRTSHPGLFLQVVNKQEVVPLSSTQYDSFFDYLKEA